jgi:AcrR family transcriptional regulator
VSVDKRARDGTYHERPRRAAKRADGSASDIIKAVGVAQGTFYYYFKSRDEILDAVIDRYFANYAKLVERMADDGRMNALQKLLYIIDAFFSMNEEKRRLAGYLDSEHKLSKHERYQHYIDKEITPSVTRIVKQGIKEGLFEVEYPKETTELIVLIFEHLHDNVDPMNDGKKRKRRMKAAWTMIEKALNARTDSIRLRF